MTPPPWLERTPTSTDLERLSVPGFHAAIDALQAETVPRSYWERVIASMQARSKTRSDQGIRGKIGAKSGPGGLETPGPWPQPTREV